MIPKRMYIFKRENCISYIIFACVIVIYFVYCAIKINEALSTNCDILSKHCYHIKYIYMANTFFDRTWYLYRDYLGPEDFYNARCPQTACVATINVSVLPRITMYDVLLFHGASRERITFPAERNRNQLYVIGIWESPTNTPNKLIVNGFFNWTISYR